MLATDKPETIDQAELAGWDSLGVHCAGCRVTIHVWWHMLRRQTRERRLSRIASLLRCERCGSRSDRVFLYKLEPPVPCAAPVSVEMEIEPYSSTTA